jgi:hypothetical protein
MPIAARGPGPEIGPSSQRPSIESSTARPRISRRRGFHRRRPHGCRAAGALLQPPEIQYPLQVELPLYLKDYRATLLRHPAAMGGRHLSPASRILRGSCQAHGCAVAFGKVVAGLFVFLISSLGERRAPTRPLAALHRDLIAILAGRHRSRPPLPIAILRADIHRRRTSVPSRSPPLRARHE